MCKDCQQHRGKVQIALVNQRGNPSAITFSDNATAGDILNSLNAEPGTRLSVAFPPDRPLGTLRIRLGAVHRVNKKGRNIIIAPIED